jgi:hypothetical protein
MKTVILHRPFYFEMYSNAYLTFLGEFTQLR